jgi:hypothetical protein
MSLALSFFLIFLMVYHFKKRMDALDRKNETLGDICKTLIKEIEYVKETKPVLSPQLPTFVSYEHSGGGVFSSGQDFDPLEDFFRQLKDRQDPHPLDIGIYTDEEIRDVEILSEEDEEDGEDEKEDIVVIQDDFMDKELSSEIENKEQDDVFSSLEPETAIIEEEEEEIQVPIFKEYAEYDESVITEEPLEESVLTEEPERQLSRRALKKMNVQMLRALAIRDGLGSDPSKMKKKELIELLNDDIPALSNV